MKDSFGLHQKRKRADRFYRKAVGLGLCCILLCFAAALCKGETIWFWICATGSGIVFLLALLFLCLAGAEGQELYLIEPCETLSDEQLEELKNILDEAREKIHQKKEGQ